MKHVLAILLFGLLASTAGCSKPKAGARCDQESRACVDNTQGLYCANGIWQADTCKGPRGCYEENKIINCDRTANDNGDPCPAALEGQSVCRADRKSRAMCKGGKYVIETCKGEDGCTTESIGMARCDRGDPEPGEACTSDMRLQFCASDKKSFVTCKDGKFVVRQKCPGPNGCKTQSAGFVSCDPHGVFAAGDDCFFLQNACTADGKSLLACKEGKFVVETECHGPRRCSMPAGCDTGFEAENEICTIGQKACNLDKKSLLECKSTKKDGEETNAFAISKKCKTACTPKDGQFECD